MTQTLPVSYRPFTYGSTLFPSNPFSDCCVVCLKYPQPEEAWLGQWIKTTKKICGVHELCAKQVQWQERLVSGLNADEIRDFFANRGGAPIDQGMLSAAVRVAIRRNHADVIRALLENERTIPQWSLNWDVKNAAKLGHIDSIRALLENGRAMTPMYLGWAVQDAAGEGRIDVLHALFEKGRTIPPENHDGAILWAAGNNHADAIRVLFKNGHGSLEGFDRAVETATTRGHTDALHALLENREIFDVVTGVT